MNIALQLAWDPAHLDTFLATARAADEAGVHSLWVNEGFGHDAFSGLALLARETQRVRLGTSIVNIYSRTPGALAQHFATIDELSGGRVIIGLGASARGVVERFHGLPFAAPLARLDETVALMRSYWKREPFSHDGELFQVDRALPVGARPVQPSPPIWLATMAPASVRLTGSIADGWLPAWIPMSRIGDNIHQLRGWAAEAGRGPSAVSVRSPGTTTVVSSPAEAVTVRRSQREALAFFIARNGDFYYRQFLRQGLAAEAALIRDAWSRGGRDEAVSAMPPGLESNFGFAGALDSCRAHLAAQAALGVDVHMVTLAPGVRSGAAAILAKLAQAPD
ncbi:MAG: LLM class flavin-dependent oxidoreductase [Dehalococcoidia bacterium]